MKKLNKEEIAEDYCFVCKDGGDLRICDYGDCLKSYHAECESKDESFLDSEERWSCRWHHCFMCERPSKFQCFTCPMAVCGLHFNLSDFALVRGTKAFCGHCLRLASLVEKNMDVVTDDEGVKIDFNEEATYERYFREYYNIIKEAEGLTAQMTLSAVAEFKKSKRVRLEADYEDIHHSKDNVLVSDYDDISDEDREATRRANKKRKRTSGRSGKIQKSKASKFIGWGSKKLIEFLGSVGEDTTKPLSQYYVESIIEKYMHRNKLICKKTVSCDQRLQSLFSRRQLKYNRIGSLLESHFAENVVHLDQEDVVNASSSDEVDDSPMVKCQNEKNIISRKKSNEFEASSVKKSCYASIVAENINLVYLRKTLVYNLLKEEPEIFKDKVVGSFVRIKSDPYDCLQKSSRQLVKVTGVNEASTYGETRFLLQVSNRIKCIPVSDISDEDFSPEELDDLRRRVEVGLLDKISVVDLEQKARLLHEDVTKHWITRRLAVLQNQIDRANEKGWRKELHEYLEAKELLQSAAEQSKLLQEVPKVVADDINDPPPPKIPERNEKPENKLPQKIENESAFFLDDVASAGNQSSKVPKLKKSQAKEGSRKEATKLQKVEGPEDPLLFSLAKVEVVSDSGDKSGDLERGEVGSRADSPSVHAGIDLEKASPAPLRICELKKIFSDCLKLDLPTLLFSNHQSCFLESMTALSKIGDFSPYQIAAMEKLIYEFPRLSSNYQFAEDSRSVSQRFMQSHASLIEATKQYRAERERIEAREKSVRENSMKIEAEIKQLEQKLKAEIKQLKQKLKAIHSEGETLISKKLELASKIDDKSAELAKSSAELDTWKIRQRKAVEERESVLATWESFRKLFLYTDDALKVSSASSADVVQRQETCSIPHQPGVKCEMEPSPSAPDKAPANRKSHQVYSHKSTEVQNQVDRDSRMWYHFSSCGVPQGPLSASLLKSWCQSSAYAAKLKVWRTGQTPEQAIPVADAILQFYP